MKTPSFTQVSRPLFGAAILFATGCAALHHQPSPTPQPAPHHGCPAQLPVHYANTALKFSLCLPVHVKKGDASAYPAGSVLLTGFSVPSGTNLESKQLLVIPAEDPNMQGATAFGHLSVAGVNFQRVQADDGSAGHSTKHIVYTWKQGSKQVHFDFALRAVNPDVFDPAHRPQQYNVAAQVKLTEDIMRTFQKLP